MTANQERICGRCGATFTPRDRGQSKVYCPPCTHAGFTRVNESWRDDAACRNTDVDAFFPVDTKGTHISRRAIELCTRCPVGDQCLEYAIATRTHYGAWGGVNVAHGTPDQLRAARATLMAEVTM